MGWTSWFAVTCTDSSYILEISDWRRIWETIIPLLALQNIVCSFSQLQGAQGEGKTVSIGLGCTAFDFQILLLSLANSYNEVELPRLASKATYLRETEEMQFLPEDFNNLCFQVTAPSADFLPLDGVEQFRRYLLLFPLTGALLMYIVADREFRVKFPLVLLCCCLRISGNGAAANLNYKLNVFTYSYQVGRYIGGQVFNFWRVSWFPWLKWSRDNL